MLKRLAIFCFALAGAIGAVVIFLGAGATSQARPSTAANLVLPKYTAQKVVYHVTETATLLHPHYFHSIVGSARNHFNAVEKGGLEMTIVLQGNGVEMLRDAMTDAKLAKAIRELKADGARFVVCQNTLVSRGYEPAELFEVTEADIVGAGVAEVAALQARGYVYLKL